MHAPVRAPVLTIPVAGRFWAASGCRRLGTRRAPFSSESATPLSSAVDRSAECDFVSLPRTKKARYTVCSATRDQYPFREEDFHRVGMQVMAASNVAGTHMSGTLVMFQEQQKVVHQNTSVMVLSVSGDSLMAITNLVAHKAHERPLALDLLWSVLQRGQEISKSEWKLLRMAIVELRGLIFIGRLFFGREDTGEVVWDCDCRPSDGAWLALKAKCPMYVHKHVWDMNSQEMGELHRNRETHPAIALDNVDVAYGTAALTTLRNDDPDPLKLLKRKLAIAIVEEDYQQAITLRDHPYMQMHWEAIMHQQAGRPKEAARINQELRMIIKREAESSADR